MMKRNILIDMIRDFEEKEVPKLVKRELVLKYPSSRKALAFIGPRRAGKTFFCFNIINGLLAKGISRDRIFYINLEDDRLYPVTVKDLDTLLQIYFEIHPGNKEKEVHLFLDEVQNVEGWERFVRRVMDSENIQVYITGSSSKLLSREIATSMRGRALSYLILPFSFREYLRAKSIQTEKYMPTAKKAMVLSQLSNYLDHGGFPEIVMEDYQELGSRIISDYKEVMLFRDIVERFKVKNVLVLKSLFNAMVSSASSTFSVNKFHNELKSRGHHIAKNTVYEYASHLEDTHAIILIRTFDYSLRKQQQSLPKPFPIDPAFLGLLGLRFSRNMGTAMENVVAIELVRQLSEKPHAGIHYWKDAQQREVDFVITDNIKVTALIQVCYDLELTGTAEREMLSLARAGEIFSCTSLFVISWDEEGTFEVRGKRIEIIPLWKWLLEPTMIPLSGN